MELESREAIEALKSYETKNLAEELVVELLLTPSSDGDGLAAMTDKIVDSDLSTEEVESLHLVVGQIRKEVGIDLEESDGRMFVDYSAPTTVIEIYWKDLMPEKKLEIGRQLLHDALGEDYEITEEDEVEILKNDFANFDVVPFATVEFALPEEREYNPDYDIPDEFFEVEESEDD